MGSDLFHLGGPLQPLLEETDWASTPFGHPDTWSPTLRGAVRLMLDTSFACTLCWGPERAMIYNAAYAEVIGDKHPAALGRPAAVVFEEAWDDIGPLMDDVVRARRAIWMEDLLVPLVRRGFLEDCWFTFSYSPVANDLGEVEGLLDIAVETTSAVVANRRLDLLGRLREVLAADDTPDQLLDDAVALLRSCTDEIEAVERDPAPVGAAGAADDDLVVVEADGTTTVRLLLGTGRDTLLVRLSPRLGVDAARLDLLRLVRTSVVEGLRRATEAQEERRSAQSTRSFSEALQLSHLGTPVEPDHLQLVTRYVAAADEDRIGGDWYDAFLGPDGCLHVVVGDINGHHREAAVAMGQARNLLRGVVLAQEDTPGPLLEAFDRAFTHLGIGDFLTTVLARVEQGEDDRRHGRRTLRWANAGHPPPLLVHPDGRAVFLETKPRPMIGLNPAVRRTDHTLTVEPGTTLVLYTDGLVERRSEHLDTGLERLRAAAAGSHRTDAEQLADDLLALTDSTPEDDVAVLVLRFHPEDD